MWRSVQMLNHSHCAAWLSAWWLDTETFLFLDLWSQDNLGLRCVYKLLPKQYNKLFKSYLCCYSISTNPVSVSVNPLLGSEPKACGCWHPLMYLLDVKHIGFTAIETPQILQLTPNHREQISTGMRERLLKNFFLVSCPDFTLVSEYMLAEGALGACYGLATLSKYHWSPLDVGRRHFGDPEMVHRGCGLAWLNTL